MRPYKRGQIAKFHSPLPEEDPDQLYVLLEITGDDKQPKALIKPLNTGLSLPPLNTVLLDDLEIAEVINYRHN